jgi:hypothetical protein
VGPEAHLLSISSTCATVVSGEGDRSDRRRHASSVASGPAPKTLQGAAAASANAVVLIVRDSLVVFWS